MCQETKTNNSDKHNKKEFKAVYFPDRAEFLYEDGKIIAIKFKSAVKIPKNIRDNK